MTDRTAKNVDSAFVPVTDEALGEVVIDGRPYVLVERETLAEIQREMKAILGRGSEGILVRAGYARGARLATRLSTLVGGKQDAFFEGLQVFAARTGLCRIEQVRTDGARVTVRAQNSFIGIAYGPSAAPVCHYLRGFFLAVAETTVHRKGLECRELSCIAAGGGTCEFEVVPVPGSDSPSADSQRTMEGRVTEWKSNA